MPMLSRGGGTAQAVAPDPAMVRNEVAQYGCSDELIAYFTRNGISLEDVLERLQEGSPVDVVARLANFYQDPWRPGYGPAAPAPAPQPDQAQGQQERANERERRRLERQAAAERKAVEATQHAATQKAAATRQATARATEVRDHILRGGSWRDEVVADGGLLVLFALGWGLNGLATAFGVASIFPTGNLIAQGVGFVLGCILHYLISRIEIAYMTWRRVFSLYAVPLLIAILIDWATAVRGLVAFLSWMFPWALGGKPKSGGVPPDLRAWWVMVEAAGTEGMVAPAWSWRAVVLSVVVLVVVLLAERVLRYQWRQFQGTLAARPK